MDNQPMTIRDLITDCGGVTRVAKAVGRSNQYVHEWIQRGHLPLSELKGRTDYSEKLAGMQQEGSLSPVDIRRIGLRL